MSRISLRWRVPLLVSGAFVLAGLTGTFVVMRAVESHTNEHRQAQLEVHVEQSIQTMDERLIAAADEIRRLQGLFAVMDPTRSDFHTYVSFGQDVEGLQALEYTRLVQISQQDDFVQSVRQDRSLVDSGYPDFTIEPSSEHPDMFVVDYVEPMEGNESAFGFDLGSNPSRRAAVERSRDTGEMIASDLIQLVQDTKTRSGFLLLLPVYEGGKTPSSLEERRRRFQGIVNGVFVVEHLISGIAGVGSTIDLFIYDSGHGDEPSMSWPLLFSSKGPPAVLSPGYPAETSPSVELEVTVGDRVWTIIGVEGPNSLASTAVGSLPTFVSVIGVVLTAAFAVTAFTLMDSRERANEAARLATIDLRSQAEDLTAARDEALQADRLKTAFLANVSHELRTPLNGVIGLSSVLDQETFGTLNDQQHDYVKRISTSGDHLLSLIDDLLDLARIEAGKEELLMTPIDLGHLVTESIDLVRTDAGVDGVALSGVYPDDGVVVMADRRRLKQVLLNLLSNAIKFTPSGGSVRVEVRSTGSEAEIVVSDTGVGIPNDELEKIFEPFHQVDSSMARARDGSGLGLTLSARLIDLHGGDIIVNSEMDKGSQFIVTWPLAKEGVANSKPRIRSDLVADSADFAGTRVLVAEDNPNNMILMVDLLTAVGCTVIEATDGREALDMAQLERPDLMLLDVQLPVMDGIAVVTAIRSIADLESLPILAVTAQAKTEDEQRILAAGCDAYLAKPFTQEQFLTAVTSLATKTIRI